MIAVRLIRRFRVRGQDVERCRLMDFAALPVTGHAVDLGEEGTPPLGVGTTILHGQEIEWRAGFVPPAATVRLQQEPGESLEKAEAGGWRPLANASQAA